MPELTPVPLPRPARPALPPLRPDTLHRAGTGASAPSLDRDAIVFSNTARAAWPRPQAAGTDPTIVETTLDGLSVDRVATELAPVFAGLKAMDKKPFAIQEVRFLDLAADGRGHHLVFEQDAGTLLPPVPNPFPPQVDPLTGRTNLQLQEARMRVTAGRYDILFNVDGEGKPSFHKLMMDGRDITRIAGDYVKRKIKEDPAVWGTAAAVAAAGAVYAAHEYVGRTGKPLGFGVGNIRLYETERLGVRVRPRAELTGDSRFVRATGAEVGVTYHDGPMSVTGGARYHIPNRSTELVATLGYQVNPTTTFSAYATHDTNTRHSAIGFALQSTF